MPRSRARQGTHDILGDRLKSTVARPIAAFPAARVGSGQSCGRPGERAHRDQHSPELGMVQRAPHAMLPTLLLTTTRGEARLRRQPVLPRIEPRTAVACGAHRKARNTRLPLCLGSTCATRPKRIGSLKPRPPRDARCPRSSGSARKLPSRHQSFGASIAWSCSITPGSTKTTG
jgi:hypothetical protein